MSDRLRSPWVPTGVLLAGCVLTGSISMQREMPLRAPLSTVPNTLLGYRGTDIEISAAELEAAGPSSYLFRTFEGAGLPQAFSVYVGYYPQQRQGKTIHSPKNCLPGAGWEPLDAARLEIPGAVPGRTVRANRFVVANKDQRAIVYYWYQGRGRTESNEYLVKLDLIADAAIKRRTEEALVRIVMPLGEGFDEAAADSLAHRLIGTVDQELERVLPEA